MTPRRKPPLEAAVQAEVRNVAAMLGFDLSDMSQGYRPDRCWKCRSWLGQGSTRQTPGVPDLYLTHPRLGLRLWAEVKRPGETPTDAQLDWHARERAAGGTVLVVDSAAAFLDGVRPLIVAAGGTPPVVHL